MKDEILLTVGYEEVISEEHWTYLMHLAEVADKQIRLMDQILEDTSAEE